jgi:hypothetical protein
MPKKQKVISYFRKPGANKYAPYATKFAGFIRAVAKAKATGCEAILIEEPWVIGDTYEEITESLSYLAGTVIGLCIITSRQHRLE